MRATVICGAGDVRVEDVGSTVSTVKKGDLVVALPDNSVIFTGLPSIGAGMVVPEELARRRTEGGI